MEYIDGQDIADCTRTAPEQTNDLFLQAIDGFTYLQHTGIFHKSITLNWHGSSPAEFREGRYDFTTEVYFLGKLFERLIQDHNIEHFLIGPVQQFNLTHPLKQTGGGTLWI